MAAALADLRALLRTRRFVVVVGGEGLSMIGDAAFAVALAWLVLQATGSVTALAGVLLAQTVPHATLLLLGGSVADRVAPRTMMLICHTVRAAVMATTAVVLLNGTWSLGNLYVLAAVMGVTGAFFSPAAESVLPVLVEPAHLARGNAVQSTVEQIAMLAGPVIGGVLVTAYGAGTALAVNATTFAVAASTCLAVPSGAGRSTDAARAVGIGRHLREGLRYAWHSRRLRLVLLVVSASTLSYAGLFAVGLPALARSLDPSAMGLAVLISSWGAGQLIGTVAAAITGLPQRWGLLIISMTFAEGLVFALLGQAGGIWWAAALLVPLGIGVAYSSDVALPTFVQTTTPLHLLARVSSVLALARSAFEPLSIALLGLALQASVSWGFVAAGLPVLVVGVLLASNRDARRLTASRAGDDG